MKTFMVRNTNYAMNVVYPWLKEYGIEELSRNGRVLRAPVPVTITYTKPLERVNWCSVRDANPFFHMAEAMWMLTGSNVITNLLAFLPSFVNFSDDGIYHNSAYGYRAKRFYGMDQLKLAAKELSKNPFSRQAVVQLWCPNDLDKTTKDKACNTELVFQRNPLTAKLDMTIFNRSDDAIRGGVSGANVVHMPFFLEYVAYLAGFTPGHVIVVSTNLHIYLDNPKAKLLFEKYKGVLPQKDFSKIPFYPLLRQMNEAHALEDDIFRLFIQYKFNTFGSTKLKVEFIKNVALPIFKSHFLYKQGNLAGAWNNCCNIQSSDWQYACKAWIGRRINK